MSFPMWTKYDADIYRSLSLFPEKLEGTPLNPGEFTSHFKDFFGRPIQDIVEALRHYGQQGYFSFELKLSPEYLEYGDTLADVMATLSGDFPDKYFGLGKPVYDKVLTERPLTTAEASNLPDRAKPHLTFSLSDIDRQRLKEELVVYDSGTSLPVIPRGRTVAKLPPLGEVKLRPGSYDKHTGVLSLAPFHDRPIAGKKGVLRPKTNTRVRSKYLQCWVMECVFKSDKTLRHGIAISSILRMSKKYVDKTTTKKIVNAVSAINKKVARADGPKNLLKIQKGEVFLNNSYL